MALIRCDVTLNVTFGVTLRNEKNAQDPQNYIKKNTKTIFQKIKIDFFTSFFEVLTIPCNR